MTQRTVLRWLSSALLALGAVSGAARYARGDYPGELVVPLGLLTLGFAGIIAMIILDRDA